MRSAIEVKGLVKEYGDFRAVSDIDLDVEEGEIFAFLGPNGAGKTTTIEILEGFRSPTSGSVSVLGQEPSSAPLSWRDEIGIVLQESEVAPELTARDAVTMYSAYYQAPRPVDEVLEIVGLAERADERVARLSGGQQRRVDLALALIGDPKLIFLDEPTTGFDPSARRESWEMIENLRTLGRTVMLTTHYMDEAQHLADRIAVIASGRIVARGTAAELAERVRAATRITWVGSEVPSLSVGVVKRERSAGRGGTTEGTTIETAGETGADRMTVEVDDSDVVSCVHQLSMWAQANGDPLKEFEVTRPSLEDTYLQLVNDAEDGGL